MKKSILLIIMIFALYVAEISACTSAIIGANATPDGRPLLWKHRDTSTIDNKVEYITSKEGEYNYVALFNADDKRCEQAWIGMNDVGFAVMNTASYNITPHVGAAGGQRETAWIKEPRSLPLHFSTNTNYH